MTEWPTKTSNQFLFGFFVQLKILVPPLSGIHAYGRFIIAIFFFSKVELFWRERGFGFTVMLPGGFAFTILLPGG
jgi:hypothetical protein